MSWLVRTDTCVSKFEIWHTLNGIITNVHVKQQRFYGTHTHTRTYCVCVCVCACVCACADIALRAYQCSHICPHTTLYVSSYYYISVLILLYICPHTTIHVCVLILLYILSAHVAYCSGVLIVTDIYRYIYRYIPICVSSYYMLSAHVALSAYYYICVFILLYMCLHTTILTTIYVSSYYYIYVHILLYTCPHTTVHSLSSRRSAHIYIRHIPICRYVYIPIYRYIYYTFSHRSACSLLRDAEFLF